MLRRWHQGTRSRLSSAQPEQDAAPPPEVRVMVHTLVDPTPRTVPVTEGAVEASIPGELGLRGRLIRVLQLQEVLAW